MNFIRGDTAGSQTDAPSKKKLKLSYEEYRNLSNVLVIHMRQEEAKLEAEESSSDAAGLHRSVLINWYLNEIANDIQTEAELLEKKMMVEKVLDRLTYHVSIN